MSQEIKALSLSLGKYVAKAHHTPEQDARMKAQVHDALAKRAKQVLDERRESRKGEVIEDYLRLKNSLAPTVDEGWGDFGRAIAKGALSFAASGLGVKKSGALKNVLKAAKKKKVVPAKAKVDLPTLHQKPKLDLSTKQR